MIFPLSNLSTIYCLHLYNMALKVFHVSLLSCFLKLRVHLIIYPETFDNRITSYTALKASSMLNSLKSCRRVFVQPYAAGGTDLLRAS